jgi:integral membrane protein
MDLLVSLNPRTRFRTVAIAEAFSWAGLLVGMLVKHVLKLTEVGVQVFGPIHGAIFVAYLVSILVVRKPLGWDVKTVLLAAVASVPPFATLAFELWADRRGRLTPEHARTPQLEASTV